MDFIKTDYAQYEKDAANGQIETRQETETAGAWESIVWYFFGHTVYYFRAARHMQPDKITFWIKK
jgi:hypothetical protein